MTEEFWKARDYIRDELTFKDKDVDVIVFEHTIRSIGGLLSAHDWSGDPVFLERALELARILIRSFYIDGDEDRLNPTGMPWAYVNLQTGKASNIKFLPGHILNLARIGTLGMEYRFLDEVVNTTETAAMRQKVEHVYEILHEMNPPNGLYSVLMWNPFGSTAHCC